MIEDEGDFSQRSREDEPSTYQPRNLPPPPVSVKTDTFPAAGLWVGPPEAPARYEILEAVGAGSEGVVHRARFAGQGKGSTRQVAIKEFRRPRGASESWPHDGTWARLADQAELLAGLPHNPHLVRVLVAFLGNMHWQGAPEDADAAPPTPNPFLVMEWIDGVRPDQLLASGDIPLTHRAEWVTHLAEAIDLLHSASRTGSNPVVHGDIKPGNCLVTPDRGLVLLDTGTVTRLEDSAGQGLFTPPYAAPEVVLGRSPSRTPAHDMYSLAAASFFLLTKSPPPSCARDDYLDQVREDLRTRNLTQDPSKLGELEKLVIEGMSPDSRVRERLVPTVWALELRRTLTEPTRRRPRKRWVVGAAASALGALALLLAPWPFSRTTPHTSAPAVRMVPFGNTYGHVMSRTQSPNSAQVIPPGGSQSFDHLWGVFIPTEFCASTVEFDITFSDRASGNFGIGVAPRSIIVADQPEGYSVQYEWESSDVAEVPGSFVRPAQLPGGAWLKKELAIPAPDLRSHPHVRVTAEGTTLTIGINGSQVAKYEQPEVQCGGVSLRVWGAPVAFENVRVVGS